MRVKLISQLCASACLMLVACQAKAVEYLPILPEKNTQPYVTAQVVHLESANQLIDLFARGNYSLKNVLADNAVPYYAVENLPNDLNNLPVDKKISGFIRLLLPTIKAVNQQLLQVREELITLSRKPTTSWSIEENNWFNEVATSYGVQSQNMNQLLLQVDIIPIGMVLAQAIDESGWGTSYFAVKGNNLYGEHLSSRGGEYLTTPGGHVKVAAFDNLYAGTASYMHNLNTTQAYKRLWQTRKNLRAQNTLTGYELVGSLSDYSTRGEAYVDNLRSLITHHDLDSFDHIVLGNSNSVFISFIN